MILEARGSGVRCPPLIMVKNISRVCTLFDDSTRPCCSEKMLLELGVPLEKEMVLWWPS